MNPYPQPGYVYRHFKGTNYVITGYVSNVTNGANPRPMVLYFPEDQLGKSHHDYYCRDVDEFMSTVDTQKYPDCKQIERFKCIYPVDEFSYDDEIDD